MVPHRKNTQGFVTVNGEVVSALDTGEILSEHQIDPTRSHSRNQLTPPGRRPQN